jgi:tetratricopeptide (TPR) repeat protein
LGEEIMKNAYYLFFLFFLNIPSLWASSIDGTICNDEFQQAEKYYESQKYNKALDAYQKCLESGFIHPDVFYNMANNYYRLEKYPQALLYYERALLYAPADEDILNNLQVSQKKLMSNHSEEDLTLGFFYKLHHFLSINSALWLVWGLVFILVLLILWHKHYKGLHAHRFYPAYAFLIISILIPGSSLAYKVYNREALNYGIILNPVADVMSGPGKSYQLLHELHAGTKVEILSHNGEWYAVELGQEVHGFIHQSTMEPVHYE